MNIYVTICQGRLMNAKGFKAKSLVISGSFRNVSTIIPMLIRIMCLTADGTLLMKPPPLLYE